MPHGLFLGSQLSTQGRALESDLFEPETFEQDNLPASRPSSSNFLYTRFWLPIRYMFKIDKRTRGPDMGKGHEGWPNNSLRFVRAHLWHGVSDVMGSLLGFALIINAVWVFIFCTNRTCTELYSSIRILIISSAVFFGLPGVDASAVGLFQAADVISSTVGRGAII